MPTSRVLAPAVVGEYLFQAGGFRRSWLELCQVVADEAGYLAANRSSGGQIAASTFFNHPFQHGECGGGCVCGLDDLQVDRRQQPRSAAHRAVRRRVRQHSVQRLPMRSPLAARSAIGWCAGFAQIAHGGERSG